MSRCDWRNAVSPAVSLASRKLVAVVGKPGAPSLPKHSLTRHTDIIDVGIKSTWIGLVNKIQIASGPTLLAHMGGPKSQQGVNRLMARPTIGPIKIESMDGIGAIAQVNTSNPSPGRMTNEIDAIVTSYCLGMSYRGRQLGQNRLYRATGQRRQPTPAREWHSCGPKTPLVQVSL